MSSIFRHNQITVVAGGWSVKGEGWDLEHLPGLVIGVNDAAVHLPKCDITLSMDRMWTENRWEWMCTVQREAYIRYAALKTLPWKDAALPWLHPFNCDHTVSRVSDHFYILNGNNSGMCALHLALHMKPREIYLLGYDMQRGPNGEAHWYEPYPWNVMASKPGTLASWAEPFIYAEGYAREHGIVIWNCSRRSLIQLFPRMSIEELAGAAR